ncbi:MAG: HAD family hydrolase [Pseudomonadota bacterium]
MLNFPDSKVEEIKQAIDKALDGGANPIAAFDADGTLWTHDAGEGFFEYKNKNNLVELPEDPWSHYKNLKIEVSPDAAYLWLAQILKGKSLDEVREWSKSATGPLDQLPTFEAQKEIIDHLHSKGVEVYVVTASIKWAVEPGAAYYGIDYDHVIGITTKVIDGVMTEEQDGPVTYREGKVTGLLEKTGGKAPFFASGNSEGDLPLLESSTHLKLVMASAPESEKSMHNVEQTMVTIAKQKGWHYHSYV